MTFFRNKNKNGRWKKLPPLRNKKDGEEIKAEELKTWLSKQTVTNISRNRIETRDTFYRLYPKRMTEENIKLIPRMNYFEPGGPSDCDEGADWRFVCLRQTMPSVACFYCEGIEEKEGRKFNHAFVCVVTKEREILVVGGKPLDRYSYLRKVRF